MSKSYPLGNITMKTTKSPENAEVTPSKKKLKQARLPFKLLSDVSPKPDIPSTRKRKLSSPETETLTKVGKICKENDVVEAVIISDEDSEDVGDKSKKIPNPYVKLVDAARKKLQKAKKKKSSKNSDKVLNGSCVQTESDHKICELMDVDESPNTENVLPNETETNELNTETNNLSINKELDQVPDSVRNVSAIINLEDSNDPNETQPETQEECSDEKYEHKSDESILNESQIKGSPSKTEGDNLNIVISENQVTPKRSMRNRNKTELSNNCQESPSTKLNDSVCSAPLTPKSSQGDISLNVSTTSGNLTPKQIQKKLESAKKKEEREKEKQEREKKRQQVKEERAKQKQDKEEQRKREREEKEEAKRKEKEEKEEQKRKEKEEKEKQKELERKQKEEKEEQKRKEREEKEEQKRKEKEAKEEEKRKKQEALELEKQEQELKKKKAAEAFTNFFVPKQKSEKDQAIICSVNNSMLSNFTVKADMRLAPLVRVDITDDKKQTLDNLLEKQSEDILYLKCLKDGLSKPQFSGKTWPVEDKDEDDDVMIIEDAELPPTDGAGEILSSESAPREKLRPKLLSFHENRRPPYWGTWRKKSVSIKPRKPFGQDQKLLDYEVDSDEEWEEEQEGESVGGSVAGSDEEPDGDEYEVDNVVFVPHGYLSDEEATMDEDDVLSLSPETQQARLKHLEDEFESEMKKPTEKLKPRMYGLLWETTEGSKPEKCADALWNYFQKMSMIMNDATTLLLPTIEPEEGEKKKVKKKKQVTQPDGEHKQKSPKSDKKKKLKPEDKEIKTPNADSKKNVTEAKKNQTSINLFLTKVKSS